MTKVLPHQGKRGPFSVLTLLRSFGRRRHHAYVADETSDVRRAVKLPLIEDVVAQARGQRAAQD